MSVSLVVDSNTFNSLPHIDEVGKKDLNDTINAVRGLISTYGLSNIVGLSRSHKHLDLKDSEFQIASAVPEEQKILVEFRVPSSEELQYLVPYQFIWDLVNLQWRATAVFDSRTAGGEEMKAKCEHLLTCHSFLRECTQVFESCPIDAPCGLTLPLHQTIFPGLDKLVETTNSKERTQWFRSYDSFPKDAFIKGTDVVTTNWFWRKKASKEELDHETACVYTCDDTFYGHDREHEGYWCPDDGKDVDDHPKKDSKEELNHETACV